MSFSSKTRVVALMAAVIAILASFSSTSDAGWRHRVCCPPPVCCPVPPVCCPVPPVPVPVPVLVPPVCPAPPVCCPVPYGVVIPAYTPYWVGPRCRCPRCCGYPWADPCCDPYYAEPNSGCSACGAGTVTAAPEAVPADTNAIVDKATATNDGETATENAPETNGVPAESNEAGSILEN